MPNGQSNGQSDSELRQSAKLLAQGLREEGTPELTAELAAIDAAAGEELQRLHQHLTAVRNVGDLLDVIIAVSEQIASLQGCPHTLFNAAARIAAAKEQIARIPGYWELLGEFNHEEAEPAAEGAGENATGPVEAAASAELTAAG